MTDSHHTLGADPGTPGSASGRARGLRRLVAPLTARIAAFRARGTHSDPDLQRAVGRPDERALFRASGGTLLMVGVLLLGFAVQVAGVSVLRHERDQTVLYEQFRVALANGTAPVGQVDADGALLPLGTPVAVVRIPSVGIDEVVVEGTTSDTMLSGPGHRRDTVLPGQAGSSVVFGRNGAYGGPFGALSRVAVGDTITTLTGQGEAEYRVTAIRTTAEAPAISQDAGRLTLVTAGGRPWLPSGVLRVDAALVSDAFATPNPVLLIGSLTPAESAMASDPSAWLPLLLLLEGAVAATWLFVIARRRWGGWHAWVVAVPVLAVLGSAIAEQTVVLLPNLF